MRRPVKREKMEDELVLAIGLVWGHLRVDQFEQAYKLALGCMQVWPNEKRLALMAAFAAVELLEPLDDRMSAALKESECKEWTEFVLRRLEIQTQTLGAAG